MPSDSSRAGAYTGIGNLVAMLEATNYNSYLCALVRRYYPGHGSAADFGAGIGTFSGCLATAGKTIVCVEPDPAQRERLESEGFLAVSTISELAPESLSYVYSLNVLEHINDDVAALKAIHAALEPEGRLLLYVPAFPMLYTSMDRKVGHVRRYRREDLRRKLDSNGFLVETVSYEDAVGFFATLAYKVRDRDGSGTLDPRMVRLYDRLVFPVSQRISPLFRLVCGKNLLAVARRN